jgi:hypothetical protein
MCRNKNHLELIMAHDVTQSPPNEKNSIFFFLTHQKIPHTRYLILTMAHSCSG